MPYGRTTKALLVRRFFFFNFLEIYKKEGPSIQHWGVQYQKPFLSDGSFLFVLLIIAQKKGKSNPCSGTFPANRKPVRHPLN